MGLFADDVALPFHSNIPAEADITVAIVYSIFGVCSVLGNSTLLYVSYKKKHQLKPAELFIINLAVSDMGLTLCLYPMAITSSIYHRWLYGETVCYMYAFCGVLFGICSLTTLTLLSMVCFVKVCCPLYGNRFSSLHGRLLVACAWTYALLFACSPLVHWGQYGPEPYGTACCIDWRFSSQHDDARSYTVALFVFCYAVPCCLIVVSYAGILATVRASRNAMERHVSRPTHMSDAQTIIAKLGVAVCIGFFAAWSPYAVVSMWAAFGHIESIPPMAFAMPAMFAKSSTIYNPLIYLMLRPNFRKVMCRDLGTLRRAFLGGCLCAQGPGRCHSKPANRVELCMICHRQPDQSCSTNSSAGPALVESRASGGCEKCSQACPCCGQYPQGHNVTNVAASTGMPKAEITHTMEPQTKKQNPQQGCHKTSMRAALLGKRSLEMDNLQVNLQMIPGHAKVAWP